MLPEILIADVLPDLPIVNVLIMPLDVAKVSYEVLKVDVKLVLNGSITKSPVPVKVWPDKLGASFRMINWPAEIIFVCASLIEPVRISVPVPALVKLDVPAMVPPYVNVDELATLMVPVPVNVIPRLLFKVKLDVVRSVPPSNVI